VCACVCAGRQSIQCRYEVLEGPDLWLVVWATVCVAWIEAVFVRRKMVYKAPGGRAVFLRASGHARLDIKATERTPQSPSKVTQLLRS
jgi:hypothetical protein